MSNYPTGTVTFLFTDIEGSTRLWQEYPQAMALSQARHDEILREAIEANDGYIIQVVGDSFKAAFPNAKNSLGAVLSAQRRLQAEKWGETGTLRVRMGLHTGAAELSADGKYPEGYTTIASAQRVMSAAHGGQVLLSQTTHSLLQYDLPEGVFLRDLGEHRLKDLRAPLRLYQLGAPGLAQDFPAIRSLSAYPNNLPLQLTSFIGREKESANVKDLLNSTRLVTLTGPGGTGKTRLSQEVGGQLLTDFSHGVWLVELAPLSDPAQILPELAHIFGLQELPSNPLENVVLNYLRGKQLLLILDNCEHLIEACARLADKLLHQCAGLKILASSREALGIAGEVAYSIPSLAESESIQLFVERASSVKPNFNLTDANASAIAQICHRLDGIPLAIELAAARVKLLSVEQIAARLDDRFRLLVGGSRTALPRQQTLRALIDWSYDLLSEEEKRLMQFASVFIGGWTLEALEVVADEPYTLDLLEQLVNKSLVVTEERQDVMRYFMLETIRQYAREKLFDAKQSSQARERHFVYFDELAERFWELYRSPNVLSIRGRSEDELENMRAALEWGLDHHPESALHLAAILCIVSGLVTNVTEALRLLKKALDQVRSLPPVEGEADLRRERLIALALFAQGLVGMGAFGSPQVLQSFQEAISLSRDTGDKRILGYSLEMYYAASRYNDIPDGLAAAEEGLAIFNEIGDWWGLYMANMNMALVASKRGAFEEKQKYLGVAKNRLQGAPLSIQSGLFYLTMGIDERLQGNLEVARQHFENGLEIFRQLKSKNFVYVMQSELGHLARAEGDYSQAKDIYRKTIQGWQELGVRPAIAHQLECFAAIALAEENPQWALKLFGAAEALRNQVQSPMTSNERLEYDQSVARLHAMVPGAEFSALWAEGGALTMDEAIELALNCVANPDAYAPAAPGAG